MWAGPLIFSSTTIRDVWIIISFRFWGCMLLVERVSFVFTNCGRHQRVSPNSLGFAGGKYRQKITIPIFRLVLHIFAHSGCIHYIFFKDNFFAYFSCLIFCWIIWLNFSLRNSFSVIVNWCRVAVSNNKSTEGGCEVWDIQNYRFKKWYMIWFQIFILVGKNIIHKEQCAQMCRGSGL